MATIMPLPAQPSSPPGHNRLWQSFFVLIVLLGLIAYLVWSEYRDLNRQAATVTQNMVTLLESRITNDFKRFEGILRFLARDVDPQHLKGPFVEQPELSRRLANLVNADPVIAGLFVFDAHGRMRYASRSISQDINIADRPHFRQLRDDAGTTTTFSEPQIARTTGHWSISVAHAIRAADGAFLGTVNLLIELDSYAEVFRSIDIGQGGTVLLRRSDDNRLVLRHPRGNASDFNQALPPENPIRQMIERGVLSGTLSYTASTDGARRIGSFKRIDPFPFYVQAAIDRSHHFTEWQHHAAGSAVLAVLLVVGFAFLRLRLRKTDTRADAALQALQQSEERYRLSQEATGVGIWDWDMQSNTVVWDSACQAMLGFAPEPRTLVLADFWAAVHPEDAEVIGTVIQAGIAEGGRFTIEFRLRTATDGWHWVEGRGQVVTRNAAGHPVRMMGTHTDIHAYRLERERAGELNERLQKIAAHIPGMVYQFQSWPDGRTAFPYCSDGIHQIYGMQPEEVATDASKVFAVLHPDDLDRVAATIEASRYSLTLWHAEYRVNLPDGQTIWVEGEASPELEADGSTLWHGHIRNITARKQVEHTLQHAKEAADAANLAKSQFLANMSHEIRTPMNGILGMAQLLLMPNTSESERCDYARTILNSGKTLLNLLNDILDLSKVESGRLSLESRPFEAGQLLQETSLLFAESTAQKGLALDVRWEGPARRYLGDPHRLRQMLSNLVGNAIKFTRQGSIRIEARELERNLAGGDALLEFSISDTGIGIPPDRLHLLFKPFSQADSSTTRNFGGTGLGLSIVKNLAELMGGEAGCESTPGSGSRFWFRVQVGRLDSGTDSRQPGRPRLAVLADGNFSGHVLVVEDDPINQRVIQTLLRKLGLTTTMAEHGQQALDMLMQGLTPDVILMDLRMPVMDGYLATERIRQWEKQQGLPAHPIFAVTANAFAEDRERCLASGMNGFLSKPIDIDALVEALHQCLPDAK